MKKAHRVMWAVSACAVSLLMLDEPLAQMMTPGSFSVSEMGAASYNVPIGVPAGVGGVVPQLALSYNSQAGNGMLGVGWNLAGLSTIARCAATVSQDGARGSVNYDMNDRYCLDGQRLIAIGGGKDGADKTEYRTEQDGLSKIISYGSAGSGTQGGPAYFVVKTKSGLTMTYGNTADSAIAAQGQTVIRTWALNQVSDTKGNYMNIVYTQDNANGQYQPKQIDYTGNSKTGQAPMSHVYFDYETRPDIVPQYKAGSMVKNTQRMTRVWTTTTKGTTTPEVGEVRIQYEASTSPATSRSRVSAIQTCDGPSSSSTAQCLPPIKLTWSGQAIKALTPFSISTALPLPGDADQMVAGDFDGDGRSDIVVIDTANSTLYTYLSRGVNQNVLSLSGASASIGTGYAGASQVGYVVQVGDLNSDGLSDLLEIGPNGYFVLISSGDGKFSSDGLHTFPAGFVWSSNNCYLNQLIDLNGDGSPDFAISCYQGSPVSGQNLLTYVNNGRGVFSAKAVQFISVPHQLMFLDWDVDGFPDLVYAYSNLSRGIFYSQKDGTFSNNLTSLPSYFDEGTCLSTDEAHWGFVDFNLDGIPDCFSESIDSIVFGAKTSYVAQYLYPPSSADYTPPTGWVPYAWPLPAAFAQLVLDPIWNNYGIDHFIMDVNGDGVPDVVFYSALDPTKSRAVGSFAVGVGRGDGYFDLQGASNYSWLLGTANKGVYKTYVDLDGDGRQDLIFYAAANRAYNPNLDGKSVTLSVGTFYGYTPQGDLPDLVTKIEQGVGLGPVVNVTYKPLAQMGSGYVKELKPTYPQVAVTPSLTVVSQTDMANGLGGSHTVTYRYGTAVTEVGASGHGFLGFHWTEHTDGPSGLTARTYMRLDWPYVGKVDRTAEYTSGASWGSNPAAPVLSNPGSYFKQKINNYACLDISNPSASPLPACTVGAGKRYFVYTTKVTTSGQDLNGAALPGEQTTQTMDGWGNPLTVVSTTLDTSGVATSYSKTTTNTYANDTGNWYLGRLLKSTVQAVSP